MVSEKLCSSQARVAHKHGFGCWAEMRRDTAPRRFFIPNYPPCGSLRPPWHLFRCTLSCKRDPLSPLFIKTEPFTIQLRHPHTFLTSIVLYLLTSIATLWAPDHAQMHTDLPPDLLGGYNPH